VFGVLPLERYPSYVKTPRITRASQPTPFFCIRPPLLVHARFYRSLRVAVEFHFAIVADQEVISFIDEKPRLHQVAELPVGDPQPRPDARAPSTSQHGRN